MSALSRFVDWWVPEKLGDAEADADTRRRARLIIAFTLAVMVWAPVFAVIYRAMHLADFSIAVLIAGAFGVVVLVLVRITGSIVWPANLMASILFAILTYLSVSSGGISSPAVPWLVAVPMVATMMVGYRTGIAWLAMILGTLGILFFEEGSQWKLTQPLDERQLSFWAFAAEFGITIVVFSLTFIYEKLKDHALETVIAANRAKSEFLTNMSHELRTPLTAILGFAEILLDNGTDSLSPADRNNKLQTILHNGKHLMELINGILDLSKIEAGKMYVERLVVSPARILDEVVTLLQVAANEKNLALSAGFEGPVPATIRTDPTRFRQILINLVGNAIKFTESGSVTVTARLLAGAAGKATLQVNVADTGIGLTGDMMAKLFEPFTQADTAGSPNHGGTGLGLAISRRLARILDGDITARSIRGKGSVFRLEIAAGDMAELKLTESPQRENEPARQAPRIERQPAADGPLRGLRILVAEDAEDNRMLVGFLLRKAGAEVAFAENGRLAIQDAQSAIHDGLPFDAILMDMQMPVVDGYAATRALRASGYALPIVALTAHAMSDDRQRCLDAGCDDYATKPIKRPELLAILGRYAPQDGLDPVRRFG